MIIGISSKYNFGKWNHNVYTFNDQSAAEKWLHTEEYDFREREIFDDIKEAVKLAGITAVAEAVEGRTLEENELWKALRNTYSLTQDRMASATGVPKRTIQNWESGLRAAPPYMLGLVESKLREFDNNAQNNA